MERISEFHFCKYRLSFFNIVWALGWVFCVYVCSVVFLFVLVMFGEVVCLFDWDVFVCFLDVSVGPVFTQ